jgi:hypothetical protein
MRLEISVSLFVAFTCTLHCSEIWSSPACFDYPSQKMHHGKFYNSISIGEHAPEGFQILQMFPNEQEL